jgi:WD40-like Beta Propeller Repeat
VPGGPRGSRSSGIQAFLQTDRVAHALRESFVAAYIYVNDRPIIAVDPSGLWCLIHNSSGCRLGGSGNTRLLADVSDYDLDPVFSMDGTQVLFNTSPNGFAQLHVVPSDGGSSQAISDVPDGWATFPAWSPDGDVIAYSCGRPFL